MVIYNYYIVRYLILSSLRVLEESNIALLYVAIGYELVHNQT